MSRGALDVGRLVGRYFQVLAVASVGWMIVSAVFFDRLSVDLTSIVFLWVGHHLVRHHRTARTLTLWIGGVGLAMMPVVVAVGAMVGTERMTISFGREIEKPTMRQVLAVAAALAVLVGIPMALLLTPRARREFGVAATG